MSVLADGAFAIVTREELWTSGRLVEKRLSHGCAEHRGRTIVVATQHDAELDAACSRELDLLRAQVDPETRTRLVASAKRCGGMLRVESTMTITIGNVSVVSRDASMLRASLAVERSVSRLDLPIVWQNGSAAVLLHEAIGHPAEHAAPPVGWPAWLSVRDEPDFTVDDAGRPAVASDLLAGPPSAFRRESFRNVPLRRMTTLVARQNGAPFQLPAEYIEVVLVAGGAYDPLTDTVTVDVAVSTAGPFRIRRTRSEIAASLAGAIGDPLPYPGVICSREGQELFVGSRAPVMVTR